MVVISLEAYGYMELNITLEQQMRYFLSRQNWNYMDRFIGMNFVLHTGKLMPELTWERCHNFCLVRQITLYEGHCYKTKWCHIFTSDFVNWKRMDDIPLKIHGAEIKKKILRYINLLISQRNVKCRQYLSAFVTCGTRWCYVASDCSNLYHNYVRSIDFAVDK